MAKITEHLITGANLSRKAVETFDSNDFSRLYSYLTDLQDTIRETLQSHTAAQMQLIIDKIGSQPLTPADMELIRLWLVGDAQSYLSQEKDFGLWIKELQRIAAVLQETSSAADTIDGMQTAQGLVRDALNLLPSIQQYIAQANRIKRFDEAMKTITADKGNTLKTLLEQKLVSPRD